MEQQAKASPRLSRHSRRRFGKLGRPTEDRGRRQREIYEAVAPLLLASGVTALSMSAAARAALVSVGGLYHYFPSKQALVLHGLQPETLHRYCDDQLPAFAALAESDPEAYLHAFGDHMIRLVSFIRPAFRAAVELGLPTVTATVDASMDSGIELFTQALRRALPALPADEILVLARTVRRLCLGTLLDATAGIDEVRAELVQLLGNASARAATGCAPGGSAPSTPGARLPDSAWSTPVRSG